MDYLSTRDAAWGHTPMDSESVRNRLGQVIFDETVARIQASSPVDIQVPKVTVPITVEIVGAAIISPSLYTDSIIRFCQYHKYLLECEHYYSPHQNYYHVLVHFDALVQV